MSLTSTARKPSADNVARAPFSSSLLSSLFSLLSSPISGGWSCKLLVAGTHDGSFDLGFAGMDVPALPASGKRCVLGPEVMTLYFNDAGIATKKTVEPCQPGPSGPPGFYILAGGKLG